MIIYVIIGMVIGIGHGILDYKNGNIHRMWYFKVQIIFLILPILAISIIEQNFIMIFNSLALIIGYLFTSIVIPRVLKNRIKQ